MQPDFSSLRGPLATGAPRLGLPGGRRWGTWMPILLISPPS